MLRFPGTLVVVGLALLAGVAQADSRGQSRRRTTDPLEERALVRAGVTITQEQIESGALPLREIQRQGRLVFSTPFTRADGYGDGPFDAREDPILPGGRPTLQGNGTFLRVNGLDGQTCLECHSIVSNRSIPARFGVGGIGGAVSNAIFRPTAIDVENAETGFDGRFINPPFLFGSGGVQLLAEEMTSDLAALAARARANPGTPVALVTKGVDFGTIVFTGGAFDTSGVEGVDPDLVVRPFGRKGEFATVRAFDLDAMQFHFGMEPSEIVGDGVDGDGDGVVDEITVGEISALEIFNTTLPRPFQERLSKAAARGLDTFGDIGCADCHRPALRTRERALPYRIADGDAPYLEVDLSRGPGRFERDRAGGIVVPLFADLKRHDMGPGLAESFGSELDAEFTTARLWGVADTAPYLHDGRATTLREAILLHGGEAQGAADAFAALAPAAQREVLELLDSLRTPSRGVEAD